MKNFKQLWAKWIGNVTFTDFAEDDRFQIPGGCH
jgi:hypothetical protein